MANYTNCQLEFTGNQALKFVRPKCLKLQYYRLNKLEGVPAEKAVGFFVPNRLCEAFAISQPVPNLFRKGNLLKIVPPKLAKQGFSLQPLTRIDLRFLIYKKKFKQPVLNQCNHKLSNRNIKYKSQRFFPASRFNKSNFPLERG